MKDKAMSFFVPHSILFRYDTGIKSQRVGERSGNTDSSQAQHMKKPTKNSKNSVVIYQAKNGAIELRGDVRQETIWATQAQVVQLFEVDQSVVSRHIRNIFKDGEVDEKSNMQKMHIANSDKPVTLYSLDMILSIGYRTNSKIAIEFRKFAF